MKQEQLNSLIRTILTLIGAFLTGGGLHYFFGHIIDTAYWEEITGVILTIVSIGWSFSSKIVDIEKLQGMVRQVVTFLCGILVAKGILNGETATAVIAFIGSILPYFQAGLGRAKSQQLDKGQISVQSLKGNFTKVLLVLCLLSFMSCKTTKLNSNGKTVLTTNSKHFNRTNPYGKRIPHGYLNPIVIK